MTTIKIGLIISNSRRPSWQSRIIESLFNSEFAELAVLIYNDEPQLKEQNKKVPVLFKLYSKFDQLVNRKKISYAEKIDVSSLLNKIPTISVHNVNDYSVDAQNELTSRLKRFQLDLFLNLEFLQISDLLLKASRYGTISYMMDGEARGESFYPPCYWEMMMNLPEIGASVFLTDQSGNVSVISRVGLSVYPNSIHINRDQLLNLGALIVPRLVKRLNKSGKPYLTQLTGRHNQQISNNNLHFPTAIETLKNAAVLFQRFLVRNLVYKELGQWSVRYSFNQIENDFPKDFSLYKEIEIRKDIFYADPFVISRGELHYIFLEEFDYSKDKGHISVITLDEIGNQLQTQTIIDRPYHMSYPFIFEWNDVYYMIPETSSNKTIELYKCLGFPDKWEFVGNIMNNINAKDSTLFFHNQKWWLFTSVNETGNNSLPFNELFIYFTNDIFSNKWHQHADNPVITDSKLSRSAGGIFIQEGEIFRPSQDCSGSYGKALNFNKISKIDEFEYSETLVSRVEPLWDKRLKGIHTYNHNNLISVIDVFKERTQFRHLIV